MSTHAFEAAALRSRVLLALFELSRENAHVSARTLADAVSTTPTRAAACLVALEREGLCDASRARLTMLGLATAAQLGVGSGGATRRKLQQLPARSEGRPQALPVAALPSQPPAPSSLC